MKNFQRLLLTSSFLMLFSWSCAAETILLAGQEESTVYSSGGEVFTSDPTCALDTTFPTICTDLAMPRQWNEMLLISIRRDLARPTVHARNLFHLSAAMYDVWAAFENKGCNYLVGETLGDFSCDPIDFMAADTSQASIDTALSYAAYRLLTHRFSGSVNSELLRTAYNFHMYQLGYDTTFVSTDFSTGSAAALGNSIAECYIGFGQQDYANEQNDYGNTAYQPVNDPLIVDLPGNPDISDYNRWQPLTLEIFIDQSGNVIPGSTPPFLSPEWGAVTPFALQDSVAQIFQRDGFDYKVYHDPGQPPNFQIDGMGGFSDYLWGFTTVITWSGHLDPDDGVMWDISPGGIGNVADFPTSTADYSTFYDQLNGGAANSGYTANPVTGQPYAQNIVPRGDYARVIAEFWADGPDSETPPGHWFTILNEYVADHPDFEKRMEGQGEILSDTEWYIKAYFMLGGAMHDAAVTAWGIKGWYDYLRPISAIRALADLGQSSDPNLPSYHPAGLPLMDGLIELVQAGDPLAGPGNSNVGKIKIWAWLGDDVIINPNTQTAGAGWILAERWVPYQRPSFVTPNFAGYVSGHSTFSSAAATMLTALTGTEYFPGGMGTFLAEQDEFLVFENGPSVDVELQWATYQDAANESALSRIWGGIHPPADDIPGRIMGVQIGTDAFNKALTYFADEDSNGLADLCQGCVLGDSCDDEDPTTFDDVFVGPCDCEGTPCPVAGTTCDDDDPSTFNDIADGFCGCAGTPCPAAGMACNDGNPFTIDDLTDGFCGCAGTPVTCETGTTTTLACDDGDPCTSNDVQIILDADSSVCVPCGGAILDCSNGPISVSPCDDGDPTTTDDQQTLLDCDGSVCIPCAGVPCPTAGTTCDDGDPNTINDVQDGFCNCTGVSSTDRFNAQSQISLVLAPNPARSYLNVTIGSRNNLPLQVQVSDSQGRQLFSQSINMTSVEASVQISTFEYPAGLYFLRVRSERGWVSRRFVVVK